MSPLSRGLGRKFLFTIQKTLCLFGQKLPRLVSSQIVDRDLSNYLIVCTDEIAGIVDGLQSNGSVPVFSVVLRPDPFFKAGYSYDFELYSSNQMFYRVKLLFFAPLLLGILSRQRTSFVYIGPKGFLIDSVDSREWEFRFLKQNKNFIVTFFTGTDIRSFQKAKNLESCDKIDNLSTVLDLVIHPSELMQNESTVIKRALVANKFALIICNAEYDQVSYLDPSKTIPYLYFFPTRHTTFNPEKFDNLNFDQIRIVHAPTNPLIKGTPIVRSAINRLWKEGYKFEYLEVMNTQNSDLRNILKESHIVINELYAVMPGVLAIEAMAHSCVTFTSGNSKYEPSLGGEREGWVVVDSTNLYHKLREIAFDEGLLRHWAQKGHKWVERNANAQKNAELLYKVVGEKIKASES